jgi:hypothetical protein
MAERIGLSHDVTLEEGTLFETKGVAKLFPSALTVTA